MKLSEFIEKLVLEKDHLGEADVTILTLDGERLVPHKLQTLETANGPVLFIETDSLED